MLSRLCRYSIAALVGTLATSQVLIAQSGKAEKAEPSGKLTLEDLLSVESVGAPVLSPDGSQFAFTRGEQILLMPAEGGWPVSLATTAGGKSGLSWSPDGRKIAYVSGGGIWVVPVVGGAPKRLTNAPPGGGDPRNSADRDPQWSPKGGWILFETGRRGNGDLMVVSEDGMTTSFLTMTPGDESAPSWAPDGMHISYTERSPEYFSGKLKVLTFDPVLGRAKGSPLDLYTSPTDRGGGWSIGRASWSHDGKELAVILQTSGWNKVYLIPATGGSPRQLTKDGYEDETPVFSPDGRSLAVVSNEKSPEERNIWIVAADKSSKRELVQSTTPGSEGGPQWSPDGSKIYYTRSSPIEPSNLMVASTSGTASPKYVTHIEPRNFAGFRMPERIRYKSKDGLEVDAMLYKPRDFKTGVRYPTVLWIHGGPEAQDHFSWDPWALYLTDEGYVVLSPNYRGSTGYGEKFRNMNVMDNGGGEMDDVAAGVRYLVSEGITDSARVAIGGGSHGGTMVGYAVTHYPDMFKAAIELFGVLDRATFVERTNRPSAIRWMMKMGGSPEQQPDEYRKANALLAVSKIKTPLLIMHGEQDPQVPPYESVQFTQALRRAGKPFWYFTYPNEGHGFAQRDHRLDAWKKQLAFLRKYLEPPFGQSITSTDDFVFK